MSKSKRKNDVTAELAAAVEAEIAATPKPEAAPKREPAAADPKALKRASALSKLRKAAAAMAEAGDDKAAAAILALIAKVTA